MKGTLVVVGTPLGNLGDLSPRAGAALRDAAVVACEDTRRTSRIYAAMGWRSPRMIVIEQHREREATSTVVELLATGTSVVLVTDAGMPAVSDPGALVVDAARTTGHAVTVIPGPSALDAVVAGSGLVTGPFTFEGFLPRKGPDRVARLAALAASTRPSVLFESPHRVAGLLDDLTTTCGADRRVAIGRELTKMHEDWFVGLLGDAHAWLATSARGEFALVVAGAPVRTAEVTDDDIVAALTAATRRGLSTRDAVAEVVDRLGVAKRRAYDLATG